ncbi:putative lipoprotein [Myxococcus stipitatus DSM 14675]|uniref:Putative lipoprotein n=1 Tax=Myxococcus stipitatus (strain DSM 14675 / JCM 12634 / Mx s8) TaxID=1278073 RepID=L7UK58_MYXSD|nr:hypothetical protein [Myxococcus stipitatus]AGC49381.1 putative lipoprotein [Myxococcus stipitatus DSM 14675]
MKAPAHIAPAALLALCLLSGCKGCKEESASPGASSPDGTAQSHRSGVEVPLPEGWSAQLTSDDSLQAGPSGRPVLRVDVRRGQGEQLPTVEKLVERVREESKNFEISLDQEEQKERYSLLRVTLAPKLADGGVGLQSPALFGARRVGDDLFLCATLSGASAEDVRLATEACRDIELQAKPKSR